MKKVVVQVERVEYTLDIPKNLPWLTSATVTGPTSPELEKAARDFQRDIDAMAEDFPDA